MVDWSVVSYGTLVAGLVGFLYKLFAPFFPDQKHVYGLAHSSLNWQDPSQLWLNMGFWTTAKTFPSACEDLVRLVAKKAGLKRGMKVFDAGYGCGDQTILLVTEYGVEEVVGVNNERIQALEARRRVKDALPKAKVVLLEGDAVSPSTWQTDVGQGYVAKQQFDAVLAIDSAYHFDDRTRFLSLAYEDLLKVDGKLVLADIIGGEKVHLGFIVKLLLGFALYQAHLPPVNLWEGTKEYKKRMENVGFKNVTVQDISQDVFPGFIKFLKLYEVARKPRNMSERLQRFGFSVFRRSLEWAVNNKILLFVLASGERREGEEWRRG